LFPFCLIGLTCCLLLTLDFPQRIGEQGQPCFPTIIGYFPDMAKKKIDLYKKMALVAPQRQSHSQFEKVFFLDSLNFHNHQ
jgi:hypothetical protein